VQRRSVRAPISWTGLHNPPNFGFPLQGDSRSWSGCVQPGPTSLDAVRPSGARCGTVLHLLRQVRQVHGVSAMQSPSTHCLANGFGRCLADRRQEAQEHRIGARSCESRSEAEAQEVKLMNAKVLPPIVIATVDDFRLLGMQGK
jgi:hypothetical protein